MNFKPFVSYDLENDVNLLIWYRQEARKTLAALKTPLSNNLHLYSGVITEFGELLDIFKKALAYGKPIDNVHLSEEWADVLWYVINMIDTDDNYFAEDIITNIRTIDLSYPESEGYSDLDKIIKYLIFNTYNYDIIDLLQDDVAESFAGTWISISYLLDIDWRQALKNNIEKLVQKRYKNEGFTSENALRRNLDSERQSLEKLDSNDVQ